MVLSSEEKKEWACELLREKYSELGRLPKKEDYEEATRSRIKAFLGPWPRALEAAGLKEAKTKPPVSKKKKKGCCKIKGTTYKGLKEAGKKRK